MLLISECGGYLGERAWKGGKHVQRGALLCKQDMAVSDVLMPGESDPDASVWAVSHTQAV